MLYTDEVYVQDKVAFFRRSKERYGGLGNMAGGYPLTVNGLSYTSSEALYQVARFPHYPDIQEKIRTAHNGFAAKLVAKEHYDKTRPNWEGPHSVRVPIMLTVLTIKTQQNYTKIKKILDETDDMEIVEWSRKDPFWGAQPGDDGLLAGKNVLGKLWMRIRAMGEDVKTSQYSTAFFPQGDDQLVDFINY